MTERPIVYAHARPAYLAPKAFAEHFGVSYMTVNRLMKTGAIKWVRVGRSMRIPLAELERFTKEAEGAAHSAVWSDE